MRIPLNRLVAFAKPYINVAAGLVAAWLVAKLNVLGVPGLGDHQNELATGLAAGAVALITWGAAQLGDLKWLKGHHIEIAADAQVQAAAITAPAVPHDTALGAAPADELDEDLVSDEEEFGAPPPDDDSAVPDNPDNGDRGEHEA